MLRKNRSKGSICISTTLSRELWEQAQEHGIKWSEALRIGTSYMLSERGQLYQNPLQMERKLTVFRERLEEVSREKDELEQQMKKLQFGGM